MYTKITGNVIGQKGPTNCLIHAVCTSTHIGFAVNILNLEFRKRVLCTYQYGRK